MNLVKLGPSRYGNNKDLGYQNEVPRKVLGYEDEREKVTGEITNYISKNLIMCTHHFADCQGN
jgi:hypothetical protein